LGFATTANAETWSCAYLHDGKAKNVIFAREGNRFYDEDKTGYYEIVYEDDSMISLHRSYGNSFSSPMYFATLLDKKKKMFATVGLQAESNTGIDRGKCKVF
tara:strand:+ start:245 stop:550 length:306 start_codon:yes stop_codon:yes gene_type:complete